MKRREKLHDLRPTANAESHAPSADSMILADLGLVRIVAAWAKLPNDVKADIQRAADPSSLAR
jgi:hypothetical protein